MADGNDPLLGDEAVDNIDATATGVDSLVKNIDQAILSGKTLTDVLGDSSLADGINSATGALGNMVNTANSLSIKPDSAPLNTLTQSAQKSAKGLAGLQQAGVSVGTTLASTFKDVKRLLGSGSVIVAAMAQEKGAEAFKNSIVALQKPLMTAQRQALQLGISMGDTFDTAANGSENFINNIVKTTLATKTLPEEIYKVQQAMKDSLGSRKQFMSLNNLEVAHVNLKSSINAVNAAILVGAATGMDYSKVAGIINESVLEFSNSTEEAVANLGHIESAARDSGFSFEKTAGFIMESTKSIKMWGGSVNAVAPLFNTFSKSLQGVGKQGLTPDLLKSFVSGLGQMSLSTRALMGIQLPGGASKGAIGAGLEMEAALDEGAAGMEKVVGGFTGALKQFGGGKIVTRQEAIADPSQERNFLVQRQLLMKMAGVDEKSATQLMGILQDIDKNGISGTQDANDRLNELMGSGESVQEKTIDVLKSTKQETIAAILSSGGEVTAAVNSIAEALGISRAIGGASEQFKDVIQRGKVRAGDIGAAKKRIVGATDQERTARRALSRAPGGSRRHAQATKVFVQAKREVKDAKLVLELAELRKSVVSSGKAAMKAGSLYVEGIGAVTKKERRNIASGNLSPRVIAGMTAGVSKGLGDKIDEVFGVKSAKLLGGGAGKQTEFDKRIQVARSSVQRAMQRPDPELQRRLQLATAPAARAEQRAPGPAPAPSQAYRRAMQKSAAELDSGGIKGLNKILSSIVGVPAVPGPSPDQFPRAPVAKAAAAAVTERTRIETHIEPVELEVKVNVTGSGDEIKLGVIETVERVIAKAKSEVIREKAVGLNGSNA